MQQFDTLILGGGPGGLAAAYGLHAQKQRVAVVEKDLWGGTCPNRGCDPKKILMAAVEAQARSETLQEHGLNGVPQIDWTALMAKKRAYTSMIPGGTESGLKAAGIAHFHGAAHFNDDGSVQVGDTQLNATNVIIATGQTPRLPQIDGQEWLRTSTDFLDLDTLPEDVTFMGAGYVGVELATIANAAGRRVHLVHHSDRPLRAFDADLVHDLLDRLTAAGIDVRLDTDIVKVAPDGDQYQVTTKLGESWTTGLVFASAGRIPVDQDLGLDRVDVATTAHGITVNGHLQTTNPHIFAIGDVVDRPQPKLTPVASYEGQYLVTALTNPTAAPIHYPVIPSVVYGKSQLAQVGVTPTQAKQEPTTYRVNDLDITHWYSYQRIEDPRARIKVVIERSSGRIVGAAVLSMEAEQVINYLDFVIQQKLGPVAINQSILAYPTLASDLTYFN
ncbi:dihydrolipoyl dehydrogenase family protein [Levilactobacillus acidifarinae]|uniref:Glutathione reductase n=1 Tax=Levilactobacillus acidifarinae DSM 19394 = JCM 15949 TaxID=1423715 RepID=A0A0R1LII7_9LACO|nr:NAD(P)/FAD-dependent oxidoreductase [Levilactobacillus acidifarinae]KRK95392.1 glutathione reductase [Levilactobacillus acidifarinae DSM 19394]GEO70015.1 glutathione reductase [Levilactobacillus acidifarinae]